MALKIVVLNSAQLPSGTEFPPLKAMKYGWEEYPSLRAEELPDRCWRAEIVVLVWSDTGVDRAIMDKLPRLRLLIAVGDAAARDQGVELLVFPEAFGSDAAAGQDLCNRITQAIGHYLRSIVSLGELP